MEEIVLFKESKSGKYINVCFENGNIFETSIELDAMKYPLFGFQKKMKSRSGIIVEEKERKDLCLQKLYQKLLNKAGKAGLNKILIRIKKYGNRHDRPHEWGISIDYVFIL